jgi:hypothetical protein
MTSGANSGNQPRRPDPATPLVADAPFPGTADSGLAWTMPSSSGRDAATFSVRGVGSAGQLVCEVALDADFFALGRSVLGPIVPDLRLRLCQAVVDTEGLRALLADLRRWEADRTPLRRQLSAEQPSQSLTVELGVREGVICTPDRPVFTVRYEDFPTHIEHGFVVDQSCVAIAIESLVGVVEGAR